MIFTQFEQFQLEFSLGLQNFNTFYVCIAIFQISREEKENQAKVVEREVKAAVSKVTAAYEERLSSARAEHSLKIQQGSL